MNIAFNPSMWLAFYLYNAIKNEIISILKCKYYLIIIKKINEISLNNFYLDLKAIASIEF